MATYTTTLTLSPSNSTSPFSFHRRGSIRRGTISSISKDIRVNDVVEIIKQQKLIQQKERIMDEQVLKRRQSMISLRTKQRSRVEQQDKQQGTLLLVNHIKKCEACNTTTTTTTTNNNKEEDNSSSSGSFSSYSNDTTPSATCSDNSLISNTISTNEELSRLNQLTNEFTNLLKDLQQDQHNMDKIKQGQSILSQQQELLNQLSSPQTNKENNSVIKSIYQDIFSSLMTPKPSTTKVIIKQTPDKNELNTTYSIQGICTTIEPAYIPQQLLQNTTHANNIHYFRYSLDINHEDRQHKFTLASQWQHDDDIDTCQEKNCHLSFNWFQRKHHCRKCGNIYCHTHSANRLPLFTSTTHKPVFSRVCDACFFSLTSNSLYAP